MRRMIGLALAMMVGVTMAGVASAAPDGKALYASKCGMCHGADGVPGKMGAGSKAFNNPEFKKTATTESITKATIEGVGKMKGMKSLSPEDMKAIAAYILAMPAAK